MKIYLAGPFFNDEERSNIEKARDVLRERGFEVFVPMEHKIEDGENLPNAVWAKKVFEMDKEAIYDCDVMVVLYYGLYSDSGTAWEAGFGSCLGKKIVVVFCNEEISSLMVVNGGIINIKLEDLKDLDFENLISSKLFTLNEQK